MSIAALDMEPDPVPSKPPPASLVSIAAKAKPSASNKAGDLTRLFELARQEASATLAPVAEPAPEPATPAAEAALSEFLAPSPAADDVEWSSFESVPEPNLSTVVPFELPAQTPLVSAHRDYSENSYQDEATDLIEAPASVEVFAELAPAPVIEPPPAPEISIAAPIDDALTAPEENPSPVLLLSAPVIEPVIEIEPPVEAPAPVATAVPDVAAPTAYAQPEPVEPPPPAAYESALAIETEPAIPAEAPDAVETPEVAAPTFYSQPEPVEPALPVAMASAPAIEIEPAVKMTAPIAVDAPVAPAPREEPPPAPAAPTFTDLADYWHFLRGNQDFPATETLDHALVTERWPGSLVIAFTSGSQDVRGEPRPAGVTRLGTACAATRDAVDYGSYATEWMLELARAALISGSGVEEMQRLQTRAGAAGFRLVALPLGRTDRDPDSVLCELVPSPAAPRFGKRRAWLQD